MKISTKGRYSVTALYELARHYGEGPVSLKSVAQSQGLSENYLEQLMVPLRRGGLVQSIRGAQGGYMLAKSPTEITIGAIITTVEGPIAVVDCLLAEAGAAEQKCAKACGCVTRGVWEQVCDSISQVLENITLQTLLDNAKGKENIGCAVS
ncbi:putative Rrf2 family transcriptional regulator [Selenomonas ruminantium subsp. lactilytica TAM6421]|uniref:Putative Rrf2 family transcriptional regulator n=1 Tax=Selenomonas ruminantium subsp. lactilytica (strain NBRC 103574 / TAM6421) TaxID=927704 RepID=I0GPA2_SELRL|nr:Rrf2 family transcriptional regulator [Selenomonas ruminantium]BAL82589.1 putative Rrf2 family transcriptional regulator [Selenomonas ruminantium subsp. lactilytica TAM6421]